MFSSIVKEPSERSKSKSKKFEEENYQSKKFEEKNYLKNNVPWSPRRNLPK